MGFDNIIELDYVELSKVFKLISGSIFRLIKNGNIIYWKEVKSRTPTIGHCTLTYNGKMIKYHRLLFTLYHKRNIKEGYVIDHINGDKGDNRISNLREITLRENNLNKECHRDGDLAGAVWHKRKKKWQSEIKKDGGSIYLGDFPTAESANRVYNVAHV